MFGYVRPNREELKIREERAYHAAYCGVCHAIGRRHGFVAQMFLSYDFAFLALLLSSNDQVPAYQTCRCPARLWCGRKQCLANPGLERAADESTILSYWKLIDTVTDAPFWRRLGARLLCLLLRRGYRRAAAFQPDFDRCVQTCLEELRDLEIESCPSLDRPADAFSRILRAAVSSNRGSLQDRAVGELLYHVGRWIYLVDAWDDREDDQKMGSYNPILSRFGGNAEENKAYLRTTLNHSRNLAASALNLMEPGCWHSILENIIYLGLPEAEELVFTGHWNHGRPNRNRRRGTERTASSVFH